MVLNWIQLFKRGQKDRIELFEHKKLVWKNKVLSRMCTIFPATASKGPYNASGSWPVNYMTSCPKICSTASTSTVKVYPSCRFRLRSRTVHRASGPPVQWYESWASWMPKRRTRKYQVMELFNETSAQEIVPKVQSEIYWKADIETIDHMFLQKKAKVQRFLVRAATTTWQKPDSFDGLVLTYPLLGFECVSCPQRKAGDYTKAPAQLWSIIL